MESSPVRADKDGVTFIDIRSLGGANVPALAKVARVEKDLAQGPRPQMRVWVVEPDTFSFLKGADDITSMGSKLYDCMATFSGVPDYMLVVSGSESVWKGAYEMSRSSIKPIIAK